MGRFIIVHVVHFIYPTVWHYLISNPRRMCEGYGSHYVLCVSVSVSIYYWASYYKAPLGFLWRFQDMHWVAFIDTLCSKVLATFADHLCLLHFLTSS